MQQVYQLIHDHGDLFYLIVFVWTALEGETFVIFAGLAAQRGMLNVAALFFAAWFGSMFGDQVFFILGRKFGKKILRHMPKLKPGVNRALGWLDKYAVIFILSYRFMYGLRNVSGVAIGLSHVPWKKFSIWNAVAAFVWAVAFVGFGYMFGDVLAHIHHKQETVESGVREITLSVLGLFAIVIIAKLIAIRRERLRLEKSGIATEEPVLALFDLQSLI